MPSNIEWTEETLNPVTGCTKISAGCKNCYAEKMAKRLQGMGQKNYANGFEVTMHEHVLKIPMNRKKPTKYFVCSMSDLFHDDVPFEFIDKVFAMMALAPQHEFIILTKRPERMRVYFNTEQRYSMVLSMMGDSVWKSTDWPLPNVMLGVSVEDQSTANKRISALLHIRAAKHFVSYEPALGPVDFKAIYFIDDRGSRRHMNSLNGIASDVDVPNRSICLNSLDLIIMGYESGISARAGHPDWARDSRDQCKEYGTAFWFKQWGEWSPDWRDSQKLAKYRKKVRIHHIDTNGLVANIHDGCSMYKVGKKISGNLLDGRRHQEWPS